MPSADPWSENLLKRAAEMWKAGLSARKIGDALHKTRSAVLGKIHRMRLHRPDDPEISRPPRKKPPVAKPKFNSARIVAQRHARRTAVAVQAPAAADIYAPFLGIALVDLELSHCRYPQGDPALFCGQPRWNGSPYCPHHHRLCFVRGSVR